MVNAYLFGGPADGHVIILEETATTLDIKMKNNPDTVSNYIVYSNNRIGTGDDVNQIFKYHGETPDD